MSRSSSSSSDDDDEVVVMRVCSSRGCTAMQDLQVDSETGELYCGPCLRRIRDAEQHGFRLLLDTDEMGLVRLVFTAFDEGRKGFWRYDDFNRYLEATAAARAEVDPVEDQHHLEEYFKQEYDIQLQVASHGAEAEGEFVVTMDNLADMYGGYVYNGAYTALRDDVEVLESHGTVNSAVLE